MVTIGVCVKDCASTIHRVIESILAQDYPHKLMEVIFVDDGSEDETLTIIKKYTPKMDMRVKIFSHGWKGLGPSRNVVVNNADGEYIIWVDGDMMIPKDFVRKQVEFMEKNPNIGVAKSKYGMVNNENIVCFLENIIFIVFDAKKDVSRLPGTGGAIFRTNAVRQVKGFDSALKWVGEDQDIIKRIISAGWLISKNDNTFFHEQRESSLKELWQKYIWYGFGNFFLYKKHKNGVFVLYKMLPLSGFLNGLLISFDAYKITKRKMVFLIPLLLAFEMTAWYYGFIKAFLKTKCRVVNK